MQAAEMARRCELLPDLVLCSPATRAWSTALCYFQELGWNYEVLRMEPGLIEASKAQLIELLQNVDESVDTLFLFGHNPGFNDLLSYLSQSPLPTENLVTSGRVVLSLPYSTWKSLELDSATIIDWTVPQ
ncbi:hypothetical protein MACH26_22550 [Planctobacterium marinum]|uniref:Phosphohistidine phosphatase n=2 Tax=Planctobacterium marinum TaxID=1631968 RepID=A0AA48HRN6_9ALTE|nr:hypothetical protein MACH26_22550 [Planctobacterium marinum]